MYFCLNTDVLPKVSYMNRIVTPNNWCHPTRVADEYILYVVNQGSLYLKEDSTNYILHAGDMLLLEPGHTHTGFKESACDYHYIHFASNTFTTFDCSHIDSIEQILIENKHLYYKCNPFSYELYQQAKLFIPKDIHMKDTSVLQSITNKMEESIRSFERHDEYYKFVCSCKLIEILTELSNYFAEVTMQNTRYSNGIISQNKKIQEILDFLHLEYNHKLTGDIISEHMNMNFDYLNRNFKKQIGLTIFEYLTIIRINKAKELLLNGAMKSYEIAAAIGFANEYHFSKAFKKTVGLSPNQYKQKL